MNKYINSQGSKKLLFVLGLGDNLYCSAGGNAVVNVWKKKYEGAATRTPWLLTLGNHDYGNNDLNLGCPSRGQPEAFTPRHSQPGTENYYQPHYNFYYELPELGLEVISIDTNGYFLPDWRATMGYGAQTHNKYASHCGDYKGHMRNVTTEGEQMLQRRGRDTNASTVILMHHYPSKNGYMQEIFRRDNGGRTRQIFAVAGHTHFARGYGNDQWIIGNGGGYHHDGGGDDNGKYGFAAVNYDGSNWRIDHKCNGCLVSCR